MNNVINMDSDLQNFCRTCLVKHNNAFNVFIAKCYNEKTYSEILMECASIRVSRNEKLSSFICHSCAVYLKAFVIFRNKCIETELTLNKFIEDLHLNIEIKKEPEEEEVINDEAENVFFTQENNFQQTSETGLILQESADVHTDANYINEKKITEFKNEIDIGETNIDCFSSHEKSTDEVLQTYLSLQESVDIKEDNEEYIEKNIKPEMRFSVNNTMNNYEQILIKCEVSDETSSSIHSSDCLFSCDLCSESFKTKTYLDEHLRAHASEKEPNKHSLSDKSGHYKTDNNTPVKSHSTNDRPFACNMCTMSFMTSNQLRRHSYLHTGEKRPFTCDLCDKSFFSSTLLVEHRRVHTGEKPFKCDVCGMSFTAKCRLEKHSYIHTEKKKPFACDLCNKSFFSSARLDAHRNLHIGEKPYRCDLCEKTFSCQANLNTHKRIHSDDKQFPCDKCTSSFVRKHQLLEHSAIHTGEKRPFPCNMCDKSYSNNARLQMHRRVHTGEKPFACTLCGAAFRLKSYLHKHSYLHTGEKRPHACDLCEKSYFHKCELKTHKKRVHKMVN